MRAEDAHRELLTLCKGGKFDRALPLARALVTALPQEAALWFLQGCVETELGLFDRASQSFRETIARDPTDAAAHYNLGCVAQRGHDIQTAIAAFKRTIDLNPAHAEAHNNLGNALRSIGALTQAIASFETALDHAPASREAMLNLADTWREAGNLTKALPLAEACLAQHPSEPTAQLLKLRLQGETCDFDRFDAFARVSETLGIKDRAAAPFFLLHCEDHPERQRERSAKWSAQSFFARPKPAFATSVREKLRIGYFSTNFHDHPGLFLTADLFGHHDKTAFEVFGYSLGPPQASQVKTKITATLEGFRDLNTASDQDIAERARQDHLDIAIDMDGHTKGARLGIFSHHTAPVQVSYLGYPGSIGAPFIDYIVADPVVVPATHRHHYAERILFMPHCYAPMDNSRALTAPRTQRKDHGLAEDAVVLCCFNTPPKIGRTEFEIWMQVLNKVPKAVLWLLHAQPEMQINLQASARALGVSQDRLIFAPRVGQEAHLERLRHADLVVDTFFYNAHTTASDALWAGVPVLTQCGDQFAARVASSLVTAARLPDLSVASTEAYQRKLHELAEDHDQISALKARLTAARGSAPLFDTGQYTRALERGFRKMHKLSVQGHVPQDIVLDPV